MGHCLHQLTPRPMLMDAHPPMSHYMHVCLGATCAVGMQPHLSSLYVLLQLLKDEVLEPVVDVEGARHAHVGHKPHLNTVLNWGDLLDESLLLRICTSSASCYRGNSALSLQQVGAGLSNMMANSAVR